MTTRSITYDDTMRNDPLRKAAVRAQIESRQAVFAQAQALVEQAATLLRGLGSIEDDPLLSRSQRSVSLTALQMYGDARFIMAEPNETYLGNRAASGSPLGWTPPVTPPVAPDAGETL